MSDHVHAWTPIDGLFGRYECACGSTGYRFAIGEIREHKAKLARSRQVDCRPERDAGGRIPPKPTSRG